MTVNELIAELQRMVEEGHGDAEVWGKPRHTRRGLVQ